MNKSIKKIQSELPGLAKSVTVALIEGLLNAIVDTASYNVSRHRVYESFSKFDKSLDKRNSDKWLYALRARGYVAFENRGGLRSVTLTNKAKMKVVDKIAGTIDKDHIYRFLSFDIPEQIRKNRNSFRKAIKAMGFKQIQQSLWVINKDVTDLVQAAAYEYKVENYIVYIVSAKSDIDGIITKKFQDDNA